MTDGPPIDPVRLARAIHRQRLGSIKPTWHRMSTVTREEYVREATEILRWLKRLPDGSDKTDVPNDLTWTDVLGQTGARRGIYWNEEAGKWELVLVAADKTRSVELSFTLQQATLIADRVLAGDASVNKPGLGRLLAASLLIYRDAADLEGRATNV